MSLKNAAEDYELFHWGDEPDQLLEVDDPRYAGEILVVRRPSRKPVMAGMVVVAVVVLVVPGMA